MECYTLANVSLKYSGSCAAFSCRSVCWCVAFHMAWQYRGLRSAVTAVMPVAEGTTSALVHVARTNVPVL
jgi:hypothetical protein